MMQLKNSIPILQAGVILLALVTLSCPAWAQEGRSTAELIALTGQAEVKSAGAAFRPAKVKDKLNVGDTIRTLEQSRARLIFQDDSVTVLGEKTTLEISQFSYNTATRQQKSLLKTLEGKIRFTVQRLTGSPQPDMTIETEVLSVGIRGTDGVLETGPQNKVYLFEAANPLAVRNKATGETASLPPMQYLVADKFKPFQINTITPEMYQRLVKEFRLSYVSEPKNLVSPEVPSGTPYLTDAGQTPAFNLPPVTQQPLPAAHISDRIKHPPLPPTPYPPSPPSLPPSLPPTSPAGPSDR